MRGPRSNWVRLGTLLLSALLYGCDATPRLAPLPSDARILAFGDSLTFGTGATPGASYPAVLQTQLGITVINAGVPGETSARGVQRMPALLQQHQPDLVILCHGGNDILQRLDLAQTERNLQQMIALAHAHHAQVVLIGVPGYGLMLSTADFYERLATTNALALDDDILSGILHNPGLKADQVHPNAAGYAQLAQAMVELLARHGALP